MWLIIAVCVFATTYNCFEMHSPVLDLLLTVGNTAKLFSSLLLSFIRF